MTQEALFMPVIILMLLLWIATILYYVAHPGLSGSERIAGVVGWSAAALAAFYAGSKLATG